MRIVIDFEGTDPPEGSMGPGDGKPTVGFAGWLGLVTRLEQLLEPVVSSGREARDGRE